MNKQGYKEGEIHVPSFRMMLLEKSPHAFMVLKQCPSLLFLGRSTPNVEGLRPGYKVHFPTMIPHAKAEVGVLDVEEKTRIEEPHLKQCLSSYDHKGSGHCLHLPSFLNGGVEFPIFSHPRQSTDQGPSAHDQVTIRGEFSAGWLDAPVQIEQFPSRHAGLGGLLHEPHHALRGPPPESDVGIQKEKIFSPRPLQSHVIGRRESDVPFGYQQSDSRKLPLHHLNAPVIGGVIHHPDFSVLMLIGQNGPDALPQILSGVIIDHNHCEVFPAFHSFSITSFQETVRPEQTRSC